MLPISNGMDRFKRLIIINSAFIVGALIAVFLSVALFSKKINEHLDALLFARQRVLDTGASITLLATLKRESQSADQVLLSLRSVLLDRDKLLTVPQEIEMAAKRRSIQSGFSFGNETTGSGSAPSYIAYSFSGQGSLNNLIELIADLESSRSLLLDIKNIELTRSGSQYSTKATGSVYFKVLPVAGQ